MLVKLFNLTRAGERGERAAPEQFIPRSLSLVLGPMRVGADRLSTCAPDALQNWSSVTEHSARVTQPERRTLVAALFACACVQGPVTLRGVVSQAGQAGRVRSTAHSVDFGLHFGDSRCTTA
uniref:Uncharacterized protein n=1 Tax=Anopheles coluzzii TaxID=1518534 RepID=A0A8W7PE59_ANOCL